MSGSHGLVRKVTVSFITYSAVAISEILTLFPVWTAVTRGRRCRSRCV